MKVLVSILSLLSYLSASDSPSNGNSAFRGVSFNSVWNQVASDPQEHLPQHKVSVTRLYSKGKDILLKNSKRTLTDHRDIIEPFKKLAHPNGVCFKGVWEIDEENIYSGYFKKGSKALIVARASSAMSNTKRGDIRAFGFAGKLFPTMDADKINTTNSANFFLIDDLGGTRAPYYTDVDLTNEPSSSMNSEVLKKMLYVAKVTQTFSKLDKHPKIRQVYEISELGESKSQKIITPRWLKIEAKDMPKVDANDFREELKIEDGKSLIFTIHVANKNKEFQKIGKITLDTSVVSSSCDRRLHFHHPAWRGDLEYFLP